MQVEPTSESLRVLLDEVIDYAGLFPPASLDLDSSIRNFTQYLNGDDRWILRSFVCPASRLHELAEYREAMAPHENIRITALGPAAADAAAWSTGCETTVRAAGAFNDAMGGLAAVVAYEMKLPAALAESSGIRGDSLRRLFDGVASLGRADVFVEIVPAPDDPRPVAETIASVVADYPQLTLGLKIRTGGITPSEVPAASAVAQFICSCRDVGVPFKATAGLHHPLYHHSRDVGTEMHGFLNVFAGSVVAAVHGLETTALEGLLRVSGPASFKWDDRGIVFGGYEASTDDVRRARHRLAVSFGSCSFDEPREDLIDLGLASPIE